MTDHTNEDTHRCGRRGPWDPNSPFKLDGEFPDTWRSPRIEQHPGDVGIVNSYEQTCSYCGSLSGDRFMELVRLGVELGPTDKSYKVYWSSQVRDRDIGEITVTVEGVKGHGKFYFQHLSREQMIEFVERYNDRASGAMKVGFPGHFYTLPFFMTRTQQ